MLRSLIWIVALVLVSGVSLAADSEKSVPESKPSAPSQTKSETDRSLEVLVKKVMPSVAIVTHTGRDGTREGLGTGFVIGKGLIATNLHVIGEARPIDIEFADGSRYAATAVHASDRKLDLAIVRIDADALPVLPLGDSDSIQQGQAVVAIGNPLGLAHSVTPGIVSARRDDPDQPMLQLGMQVLPGNSGGPVLDMQGRVHGVVTQRSLIAKHVGYAVTINSIKQLLEKPNSVPMSRWLTIGAIDPKEWSVRLDGRWRQRAGKIVVDSDGGGSGGRTLCIYEGALPDGPYEVAVAVRLGEETGAAGLVFGADAGDRHFGFYPSAGKLRLSRFDGPDVFTWRVLEEIPCDDYHPGEWNTLKVRVEKDRIAGYVNDRQVVEWTDSKRFFGKIGLAKFRDTSAEFKNFRVAPSIPAERLADDVVQRIQKQIAGLSVGIVPSRSLVESLTEEAPSSIAVIESKAREFEKRARELKELATSVHQRQTERQLKDALQTPTGNVDLVHAALLVASLDNPELDVEAYRRQYRRLADQLKSSIKTDHDESARLAALNRYFFEECGFHGSRNDYSSRSNSYLNEVLDDREGIPITLSLLYLSLANEIGLKVEGVGLPGHFVVRHIPAAGEPKLIDVFETGVAMSEAEAGRKALASSGRPLRPEHLEATDEASIVFRMLRNLLGWAQKNSDAKAGLRYLDAMLVVDETAAEERFIRAVLRMEAGRREEAIEDADWLIEHQPAGIDQHAVLRLRRLLEAPQ